MRNGIKLTVAGLVIGGTVAGAVVTGLPVAQASETPAQATCAAYQAWVRRPTTANLDTMVVDSLHAPYKYAGEDAIGLYKDVASGKSTYVAKDEAYFSKDC